MRPANETPVNATAARVIQGGFKYKPAKVVQTADQPAPFLTLPLSRSLLKQPGFVDLTGKRVGRLTVYGLTDQGKSGALWACRCDCGTHTLRKAKALKNESNADVDRCEECRHLNYLKRMDQFRQSGRNR